MEVSLTEVLPYSPVSLAPGCVNSFELQLLGKTADVGLNSSNHVCGMARLLYVLNEAPYRPPLHCTPIQQHLNAALHLNDALLVDSPLCMKVATCTGMLFASHNLQSLIMNKSGTLFQQTLDQLVERSDKCQKQEGTVDCMIDKQVKPCTYQWLYPHVLTHVVSGDQSRQASPAKQSQEWGVRLGQQNRL